MHLQEIWSIKYDKHQLNKKNVLTPFSGSQTLTNNSHSFLFFALCKVLDSGHSLTDVRDSRSTFLELAGLVLTHQERVIEGLFTEFYMHKFNDAK